MHKTQLIAVLALDSRQFLNWCHAEGMTIHHSRLVATKDNQEFIYISGPDRVRGIEFHSLLCIGTWYMRKDSTKLLNLVKSHTGRGDWD